MRERVHSHLVVRGVHAHRLLSHSRLICVSRTLIVIREGDDASAHTEYHRRMDLTMSVRVLCVLLQICKVHGYHSAFFLFDIEELNETLFTESLKIPLNTLV